MLFSNRKRESVYEKEKKIMGARVREEYTIKKKKKGKKTDLIVPKTFVTYKYNYVIVIQNAQV